MSRCHECLVYAPDLGSRIALYVHQRERALRGRNAALDDGAVRLSVNHQHNAISWHTAGELFQLVTHTLALGGKTAHIRHDGVTGGRRPGAPADAWNYFTADWRTQTIAARLPQIDFAR